MGYSHYWYTVPTLDKVKFAAFSADCKKIFEQSKKQGIELANGMGEVGTEPEITEDAVLFNGAYPNDFETACITRIGDRISREDSGKCFNSCKTQMRPYDTTVVAVTSIPK